MDIISSNTQTSFVSPSSPQHFPIDSTFLSQNYFLKPFKHKLSVSFKNTTFILPSNVQFFSSLKIHPMMVYFSFTVLFLLESFGGLRNLYIYCFLPLHPFNFLTLFFFTKQQPTQLVLFIGAIFSFVYRGNIPQISP